MEIKQGSKVKIHYKGTLEDGKVFDTSEGRDPLAFEVGAKQVIPGFEEGIIGLKKGDKKKITLEPDKAYGQHNPQMIISVPRNTLPQDQEPKAGMHVMMSTKDGKQMRAEIKEVNDEKLVLDMNHPLAGKTLTFELEVVDVE